MWDSLLDIGYKDFLDIALVAVLFYSVLIWMKRAKVGPALVGILIVGGVIVLARVLGLPLTASIFQGFIPIFLIVLVVVFQKELRQLFEHIAVWSLRRKRLPRPSDEVTETLCSALNELASRHEGALVVIPGRDPLERHLQGGERLDGRISHSLLVSLFDSHSHGHDGAVILSGDRVARFAVQLPLSSNFDRLGRKGMRHSAALGLTEQTDALCIVVSEERGEVAVARDGHLHVVGGTAPLKAALEEFFGERSSLRDGPRPSLRALRENWPEKALAGALALGLWLSFVSGMRATRRVHQVPVVVDNIAPDFVVKEIDPKVVAVTFSGLRRDFYFLDTGKLEIRLDASAVALGRRNFEIATPDVRHPPELAVQELRPREITLSVEQVNATKETAAKGP